MINNKPSNTISSSGLPEDEVKYTISQDEETVDHISSILRNLYSEPRRAVFREYIANALDAHKAKGNTDEAIRVHLPTRDEPWFEVRDFGNGMGREDTEKYLFGYGASGDDKRGSNDMIGGFGIGCKCGFAITDSFIYEVYFQGTKQVWSCYLNEKDQGRVKPVSFTTCDPDEKSGILVRIPMEHDLYSGDVGKDINRVVRFLPGKIEFSNLEDVIEKRNPPSLELTVPMVIDNKGYEISYRIYNPPPFEGHETIIVGGASYLLKMNELDIEKQNVFPTGFTIDVPIGFVQIAPSREELIYSVYTKRVLSSILNEFHKPEMRVKFLEEARKFITTCPLLEKYSICSQFSIEFKEAGLREKGLNFPADCTSRFSYLKISSSGRYYSDCTIGGNNSTINHMFTEERVNQQLLLSEKENYYNFLPRHSEKLLILTTGDEKQSEVELIKLAAKLLTKFYTSLATAKNVYVVVLGKANLKRIPWLEGSGIPVVKVEELAEVLADSLYFDYTFFNKIFNPLFGKQKRKRTTYPKREDYASTKLVELRETPAEGMAHSNGIWWNKVERGRDVSSAYFVYLQHFEALMLNNDFIGPKSLSDLVEYLRKQGFITGPVYGLKIVGQVKPKPAKGLVELFSYLKREFLLDITTHIINKETLIADCCCKREYSHVNSIAFAKMDLKAIRLYGNTLSKTYSVLCQPEFNKTRLRRMTKWLDEIPEGRNERTDHWKAILAHLADGLGSLNKGLKRLGLSPNDWCRGKKGRMTKWYISGTGYAANPMAKAFALIAKTLPMLDSSFELSKYLSRHFDIPRPTNEDTILEEAIKNDEQFRRYLKSQMNIKGIQE